VDKLIEQWDLLRTNPKLLYMIFQAIKEEYPETIGTQDGHIYLLSMTILPRPSCQLGFLEELPTNNPELYYTKQFLYNLNLQRPWILPPIQWQVQNYAATFILEHHGIKTQPHFLTTDEYMSTSLNINKLIRVHTEQGYGKVYHLDDETPDYRYRNTVDGFYTGPGFGHLDVDMPRHHAFQSLQWLITLSLPLPVIAFVFRWNNGEMQHNLYNSLQPNNHLTLTGYTSTSWIPWLGLYYAKLDQGAPYGMVIELPVGTRGLNLPNSFLGEFLLAHGCVLRFVRKFSMVNYHTPQANIPVFVFTLIYDGIPIKPPTVL
jgi:hypothetical protein